MISDEHKKGDGSNAYEFIVHPILQPSGQNLKACQLVSFGLGKPDGSGEKRLEELFEGHWPSEGRKNRVNFPAARGKRGSQVAVERQAVADHPMRKEPGQWPPVTRRCVSARDARG